MEKKLLLDGNWVIPLAHSYTHLIGLKHCLHAVISNGKYSLGTAAKELRVDGGIDRNAVSNNWWSFQRQNVPSQISNRYDGCHKGAARQLQISWVTTVKLPTPKYAVATDKLVMLVRPATKLVPATLVSSHGIAYNGKFDSDLIWRGSLMTRQQSCIVASIVYLMSQWSHSVSQLYTVEFILCVTKMLLLLDF